MLLAVTVPGAMLLAASPAAAATSAPAASSPAAGGSDAPVYVYWSYWSSNSASGWTFATVGSASVTPADGSVEGWRYGAGEGAGPSQPPSVSPDFGAACGATTATAGKKRVAVVIDPGTAAEASGGATPPGLVTKCAQVDVNANGTQVLNAVTQTRMANSGMVCGINGYPASGCGVQVSASQLSSLAPGSTGAGEQSSSRLPWIIGIIVIVIIGLGAWIMSRRQRS